MKLGHHSRIVLAFTAGFVLVWGGASLLLSARLTDELDESLVRQASTMARNLALWSEESALTEARVELLRLIVQTRASNPDVVYAFVEGADGQVLAHSFDAGFPAGLLRATHTRDRTLLETEEGPVLDFRAPILRGRGGEVHVGYSRRKMLDALDRVRNVIWYVAVGVLLAGIVAILIVAGLVTRPARELTGCVRRLESGDLSARVEGRFHGELKALGVAFNDMATSLESQAAELQYLTQYNRNLLDHLGVGVHVFNGDLRVEYANREVTEQSCDVVGKHCHEVFGCPDTPCADCLAVRALEDLRVHAGTRALPDGRRHEQTAIPSRNLDGAVSVVVTTRDVTRSLEMRERIARSEKLAAVGELAAAVAHEVNNPLDGMQSLVRIVLDDPGTTHDTREHLEMVRGGLQRIETCVRRLLTFAADPGESTVHTTVKEQVEHALALTRGSLQDAGIRTAVEIEDDIPPLLVEPDRFPQLIVNLLLSASDTVAEGGAIRIHAARAEDEIRILFENRGPGAPPEHRGRLFLPFFVPKGPGQGSVLGLAVSRRIAEEHGGRITVMDAPGGGAAYELYLPVPAAGAAVMHVEPTS